MSFRKGAIIRIYRLSTYAWVFIILTNNACDFCFVCFSITCQSVFLFFSFFLGLICRSVFRFSLICQSDIPFSLNCQSDFPFSLICRSVFRFPLLCQSVFPFSLTCQSVLSFFLILSIFLTIIVGTSNIATWTELLWVSCWKMLNNV